MYNKTNRKLITPEWWREWLARIYASHHFNIIINQINNHRFVQGLILFCRCSSRTILPQDTDSNLFFQFQIKTVPWDFFLQKIILPTFCRCSSRTILPQDTDLSSNQDMNSILTPFKRIFNSVHEACTENIPDLGSAQHVALGWMQISPL